MDLMTHVRTFVAAGRLGSFTETARELGVVPSVVAKRIGQLEEELRTRLFERTTRRVTLTEAGEKFFVKASNLVADFEQLVNSVERDDGQLVGHLRVMAPTTLATQQLAPVFRSFLLEHPRITLEVSLVDRSANPAERGFDIAISGRAATYEGVVDVPLCPVRPLLCAAPSYLASRPPPTNPRDLADHSCLVFSATGTTWRFQGARGVQSVDVTPRLLVDETGTLLDAACAGLGLALLPEYVAGEALLAGSLQNVLPDFSPQENWFKAYVPRRRLSIARVKAMLEWLDAHWAKRQGVLDLK
ncbi:HTH-type transcriptional regulator DmlR [Pigmentiphaga humi]|uniref:HTH-type transcriptional regulator DmlR n=2 Tax=Pigmentiphaga humi TaxID=2478468 RepID=A0A3P4B6J6_9BURK|nr:HTH-type transcriptional regulator DmlR [Pigmentiphaga humi]